jgi:hypothetical protein
MIERAGHYPPDSCAAPIISPAKRNISANFSGSTHTRASSGYALISARFKFSNPAAPPEKLNANDRALIAADRARARPPPDPDHDSDQLTRAGLSALP